MAVMVLHSPCQLQDSALERALPTNGNLHQRLQVLGQTLQEQRQRHTTLRRLPRHFTEWSLRVALVLQIIFPMLYPTRFNHVVHTPSY